MALRFILVFSSTLVLGGCSIDRLVDLQGSSVRMDAGLDVPSGVDAGDDDLGRRDSSTTEDSASPTDVTEPSDRGLADTSAPDVSVDSGPPAFCEGMAGIIYCQDFETEAWRGDFRPSAAAFHETMVVAEGSGALRTTRSLADDPDPLRRDIVDARGDIWFRATVQVSSTESGPMSFVTLSDSAGHTAAVLGLDNNGFYGYSRHASEGEELAPRIDGEAAPSYRCLEMSLTLAGGFTRLSLFADGVLVSSDEDAYSRVFVADEMKIGTSWLNNPDQPNPDVYFDNVVVSTIRNPCPT